MNRWTRINLGLAVAAVGLSMLLLWPASQPDATRLTGLLPDDIRSIRIVRQGRLELALNRSPDGWALEHPRTAAASERRVGQLLALTRAPVLQRFPGGADKTAYGLDQPAARLSLDDTQIVFGDRDLTQRLRYVATDGRIGVIDDVYFNLLTLPANHFEAR